MATITPTENAAYNAKVWTWTGVSTADTATEVEPGGQEAIAASVQMEGTWGSATVVLQGSNDGTNWATLKDLSGSDISFTADGMADFSSAALFIRPSSSGGTADDVNVTLAMRG